MRILVTGGAGFIGSHLCERLVARGDEVVAMDDLSTGRRENVRALEANPGFTLVEASVLDARRTSSLVASADRVFHLAAAVGVRLVLGEPDRVVAVNVEGTRNVVRAAALDGTPVLLASSSEVYGKGERIPFREEDALLHGASGDVRWCYARSKRDGERLVLPEGGIVARIFNTVGPRQRARYGMVLPSFVRQAVAGDPITVYGDGRQTRSFLHVRDTVSALVALSEERAAACGVFNVGGTREVSIRALAELVRRETESASPIVHVSRREAYGCALEEPRRRVPHVERLVEHTGFRPAASLREIVREIAREERFARALAG